MLRSLVLTALLLLLAPAAASATIYSATLTGTQTSEWSTTAKGTCTGDDFQDHPYSAQGSGTTTLDFRTKKATTVVAFQQGRSTRWGFDFQASPAAASGRPRAPFVAGRRSGTYSATCPGDVTPTRTEPTDGCGARSHQLDVKAWLNLPSRGKPGELTLEGLQSGSVKGAEWGDACPNFVGLRPFKPAGETELMVHDPDGGLLTVRKRVGSDALRRGKALTIKGERTLPYDQTSTEDRITTHVRGKTIVRWTLKLTPKR